ncbi:MAG: hypothetical protein A2Y53_02025 [Chloroflexi bacterium RBG_16_47_49]|nr:MAG: hypothetical protein A2Y53_02025 [Chloroflexi bacterium RBG_16_47_49]
MPLYQQIIILVFSFILLISVWQLVRYGKLRPAYALVWMICAVVFFLFSLFTGLVHYIASVFVISYAPVVVISLSLGFIIILLLSQSVIISSLSRNNRDLAQYIAILDWRLHNIEKLVSDTENKS